MGDDNQVSGKSNKRKKRHSKYLQHGGKKSTISSGVQGFLITCVGGKERQSIREAISLLDEFYEKSELRITTETVVHQPSTGTTARGERRDSEKPPESEVEAAVPTPEADTAAQGEDGKDENDSEYEKEDESSDDEEPEDDAGETLWWVKSRRLDESGKMQGSVGADNSQKLWKDSPKGGVKVKPKDSSLTIDQPMLVDGQEFMGMARFVGYETGCNGVIFVRMHLQKGVVEEKGPKELAEAIVRDAAATKQSKTRHCMRFLPIELTCYASTAEMLKVAGPLIQRHFPVDRPSIKFAVVCEARANTNLKKMEFINAIAKLVPDPHTVDLKNPQKTILVQVVKTACAIGVVQDFKELAKYNLRQLTTPEAKTPGKVPAE